MTPSSGLLHQTYMDKPILRPPKRIGHGSESDPAEYARRCGPETPISWRGRVVCSRSGSRNIDVVVIGVKWWGRCLVIEHDNGRRPVDRDFRNVPTIGEIATEA